MLIAVSVASRNVRARTSGAHYAQTQNVRNDGLQKGQEDGRM